VVDDDPTAVTLMRHLIEREGFTRVVTASDGRQALDLIREQPPDVVVLDVHLPELDGLEVLREIVRSDERTGRPTGVLGVSGDVTAKTAQSMLWAGATTSSRARSRAPSSLRVRRLASRTRSLRRALAYSRFLERRTGFLVAIPSPLHRPIPFRVGADHGRGSPPPGRGPLQQMRRGLVRSAVAAARYSTTTAVELGVSASVGLPVGGARAPTRQRSRPAISRPNRSRAESWCRRPGREGHDDDGSRDGGTRPRHGDAALRFAATRHAVGPDPAAVDDQGRPAAPLASTVIGAPLPAHRTASCRKTRAPRKSIACTCSPATNPATTTRTARPSTTPPSGVPIVTVGAGREGAAEHRREERRGPPAAHADMHGGSSGWHRRSDSRAGLNLVAYGYCIRRHRRRRTSRGTGCRNRSPCTARSGRWRRARTRSPSPAARRGAADRRRPRETERSRRAVRMHRDLAPSSADLRRGSPGSRGRRGRGRGRSGF
jgi:CheY-like chemotaxis protein